MKKIRLLFVLCYFINTISQAQNQLDCDSNFREAIFYLQGD